MGGRMQVFWAMVAACLLAGPLAAQPAPYRVVNVDQTDTLQIRETPSPTGAIIGTLGPNARQVEVLEARHGWGRILAGEGQGWVSLAYLAPQERARLDAFDAPAGFHCTGTEPFWGLEIAGSGTVRFHDALTLGEDRTADIFDARTASARFDPHVYHFTGDVSGFAVVSAARCSDGMSERDYGWRALVDVRDDEGGRFLEGCCRTPVAD